ncbi:hypothetical protein GCM10023339_47630 [Alloalcanivorax gelatiniphagus]
MFGRRKQTKVTHSSQRYRLSELLNYEVAQGAIVLRIYEMGDVGDAITPEFAWMVGQVVGAEQADEALRMGASLEQCQMVRSVYDRATEEVARHYEPGGKMHGFTVRQIN